MKILIVETDYDTVESARLALNLNQPDWELSAIESGKECLDILKNGSSANAVILGMKLTDMSGLDLVEQIRDNFDIPIIFLSRDRDMQTLVKAFEVGANDYIVKPFNKTIFVSLLRALIRRSMWDKQTRKLFKEGDSAM